MAETTFQRKVREHREKLEQQEREAAKQRELNEQFAPENPYERSDSDKQLDDLIERIDIITAYERWADKGRVAIRSGQADSIKVRCPNPSHPDNHPSAWLNTDKGVGNCAVCGGFDPYTISAWHFGFDMNTYQQGQHFRELRERIALDYGFIVSTTGAETIVYRDEPTADQPNMSDKSDTLEQTTGDISDNRDKTGTLRAEKPETTEQPLASNVSAEAIEEAGDILSIAELPWRKIVPHDTFIDSYMNATIINEAPEEYHFFNALLAIGFALGRRVTLGQAGEPIFANLFVCFLGRTGNRKSTSLKPLRSLLHQALPYTEKIPNTGCKFITNPNSPEILIKTYERHPIDPLTFKPIPEEYERIHGLLDINELSALMARTQVLGSTFKSILMQFYDMDDTVESHAISSGAKIAFEPYMSLVTTTQPATIYHNLRQIDNSAGFLNRFVFSPGLMKDKNYITPPTIDITPAVEPLKHLHDWSANFTEMTWELSAKVIWNDFYHDIICPIINPHDPSDDNAIYQRLELTLMKLFMLLSANKEEQIITPETVEEGLSTFDYLLSSYKFVSGALEDTPQKQIMEAFIYQLNRLDPDKKGLDIGKLSEAIRKKKFPPTETERVLRAMFSLHIIEEFKVPPGPKGGRPTIKVRLLV